MAVESFKTTTKFQHLVVFHCAVESTFTAVRKLRTFCIVYVKSLVKHFVVSSMFPYIQKCDAIYSPFDVTESVNQRLYLCNKNIRLQRNIDTKQENYILPKLQLFFRFSLYIE
jgi:hypothetical protein